MYALVGRKIMEVILTSNDEEHPVNKEIKERPHLNALPRLEHTTNRKASI
jgi:hypothetical protein